MFNSKRLMFALPLLSVLFLLPFASVGGGGSSSSPACNAPCLTLIQRGNVTVTVTGGTTAGSTTVTYSPAFTAFPHLSIVTESISSANLITVIPSGGTLPFLSDTTTTWFGMPAATTEVFGDANHEHMIQVNWQGINGFRFGVDCIAPSNTPGAYLTVEYFNTGTGLWTEVNSAQRAVIDGTGVPCPNGPNPSGELASPSYASIPAAAKTSTIFLRVTGTGGGGALDIPAFSQLWVDWSSSLTGNPVTSGSNVATWRVCSTLVQCTSPQDTSLTGFIVQVIYGIAPTATQTWRFTWTAGLPA